MSEDHKMTKQDKLVLTITLIAIFGGVFFLQILLFCLLLIGSTGDQTLQFSKKKLEIYANNVKNQ